MHVHCALVPSILKPARAFRVGVTVGKTVETSSLLATSVRMLGPLAVMRGDLKMDLPQSRKARALLAYLVLAERPISRSDLCDLFWDGTNDPRAELRWCLSKIRHLFKEDDSWYLDANRDAVAIELKSCLVDVMELPKLSTDTVARLSTPNLASLASVFTGPFLSGLALEQCHSFDAWPLPSGAGSTNDRY
jgi:DNA-binding SARP family transcriptional activator